MTELPNLAPRGELDRAKKEPVFTRKKLVTLLQTWRQEMRAEGETQEWINRILSSQANELFYRGYQRLRRADLTNTWRIDDPKPVHYTLNEFQFWVNVNVSKWVSSKVDPRVSGLPNDDEDAELQAQKLEDIVRYYDNRFWDRTRTIAASKAAQFTGYLVAYVFYNAQAKAKAVRPVTERVRLKLGADSYRCADCGYVGELDPGAKVAGPESAPVPATEGAEDPAFSEEAAQPALPMPAPVCEACGSDMLAVTEVPEEEFEVVTGEEEYETGDIDYRLISLYNVRWNAALGLAGSSLVLWEEDHEKEALEATYPGLQLPDTKAPNTGLDAKAILEHAGRDDRQRNSRRTLSRLWVEPSRYHNIELEEDMETVAGVQFPAGTRLIELFPRGMHIIACGDLILDLFAAVKNEDLAVMEYHGMPSGGLAQGVDAMREPQRQKNTVMSLINLWVRHQAAPPKRYNPELIDPGDLSGDPTRPIPINAANLGLRDGATIENAIVPDPPTPMPGGVFAYKDALREEIQFAAQATEFSSGLPNVNNETLGGARIAQSLAQSIAGTILAQFADFRIAIAKRVLKKFREYCWDKRYVQYAGRYGHIEGLELSAKDIPEQFELDAVPNSWLPRTAEQRQANFQSLLMAVGGVQGLVMTPPDALAELCEIYDVRLDANMLPTAIRTARMRIKQMASLLPALQQFNEAQMGAGLPMGEPGIDPMTGQPGMMPTGIGMQLVQGLQPPFNPREKGCREAAEYLSSWFTTDEGLQADPALIEAVGMLQDLYLNAQAMQQTAMGALAMAGQPAPMLPPGPGEGEKPGGGPPKPSPGASAPAGG